MKAKFSNFNRHFPINQHCQCQRSLGSGKHSKMLTFQNMSTYVPIHHEWNEWVTIENNFFDHMMKLKLKMFYLVKLKYKGGQILSKYGNNCSNNHVKRKRGHRVTIKPRLFK